MSLLLSEARRRISEDRKMFQKELLNGVESWDRYNMQAGNVQGLHRAEELLSEMIENQDAQDFDDAA